MERKEEEKVLGGCLIRSQKNFGMMFDDYVEIYALNILPSEPNK